MTEFTQRVGPMNPRGFVELWAELEDQGKLVERAYPVGHPVRELFRGVSYDIPDDHEPTMARLRAAREGFDALPPAERRRAFNGWEPYVQRGGGELEEWKQPATGETFVRVMRVSAKGDEVDSIHRLESDAGGPPAIAAVFPEGTTRAEALAGLADIAAAVATHWPAMIAPERLSWPVTVPAALTRRPPMAPDVAELGGSDDVERRAPAAA